MSISEVSIVASLTYTFTAAMFNFPVVVLLFSPFNTVPFVKYTDPVLSPTSEDMATGNPFVWMFRCA